MTGDEWDSGDRDDGERASRLAELQRRILDSASLDSVTPPNPLIDGFLYLNSLGWLTGQRGACKSFIALDMAGCIGGGQPWQGIVTKPGPVLYVVGEGLPGIRQRVRAWEEHYAAPMAGVTWLPGPVHLVGDGSALAAIAQAAGASLVVLDTQATLTVGMDEISSRDMGQIVASMDRIREVSGACVLSVHHEAIHGDRPRGHSVMDGAATTLLRCVKDGDVVWLGNTKQKDAPQQATIGLQTKLINGSLVLTRTGAGLPPMATDSEQRLFRILQNMCNVKGGASATELREGAESVGIPKSTFYWALKRLLNCGFAANEGKGRQTWYVARDPAQLTLDKQLED